MFVGRQIICRNVLMNCMEGLIASIKKGNVYIVLVALSFVFLVSCNGNDPIQVGNVEKEDDSYKQSGEDYCGRGRYVTYGEHDITIGEINGNPSIYFSDVGRILRTFKIKKNVEVTDNGKIII